MTTTFLDLNNFISEEVVQFCYDLYSPYSTTTVLIYVANDLDKFALDPSSLIECGGLFFTIKLMS